MLTHHNAAELARRWRARRQDLLNKARRMGNSPSGKAPYHLTKQADAWELAAKELAAKELEALCRERPEVSP